MFTCPLCQHHDSHHFHSDKKRQYFRCQQCALVFVHPKHLPSLVNEKSEYDLHQNSLDDPGYRRFLNRLCDPLVKRLAPRSHGLDFGCGPGPLLAEMLIEHGFPTERYDPIYFPNQTLLKQHYDFITCTEAVEHFHQPEREWRMFGDMLNPDGLLAIMTKRVLSEDKFANWHYKNDPTHVSFYSDLTFAWLQSHFGLKLEYLADDVVIMRNAQSF